MPDGQSGAGQDPVWPAGPGVPQVEALLRELIGSRRWRLYALHQPSQAQELWLAADGTVQGYNHPHERRWELREGHLSLLHEEGWTSVTFDTVAPQGSGLHLQGRHLLATDGPVLCLDNLPAPFELPAPGPLRDAFRHAIDHHGWRVGNFTYGLPEVVGPQFDRLEVGAYCSIGGRVTFVLGQHNHRFVSTFPFRLLPEPWTNVPHQVQDHVSRGPLLIGNDVWIGNDAVVMGGLGIGDGAIVGANAVVTRDVPPYAIVAGVPAKVIGFRFDPDVIARLLRLRWWSWPRARIDRMLPLMLQEDIHRFLDQAEQDERGHDRRGHGHPGHGHPGHEQAGHGQPGHEQAGHEQAGHRQARHEQAGQGAP